MCADSVVAESTVRREQVAYVAHVSERQHRLQNQLEMHVASFNQQLRSIVEHAATQCRLNHVSTLETYSHYIAAVVALAAGGM
jgi:two-component sensor histidine kinase